MEDTTDDVYNRMYGTPAPVPRIDAVVAVLDRNVDDDADYWAAWTDIGGEG